MCYRSYFCFYLDILNLTGEIKMFKNLGQVMVYVKNLDAAKAFWTEKSGFSLIDDQIEGDIRWIEIAPTKESETSIVLHDKAVIAKMSPELNLGTPSLMFITDDVEGLYQEFKNKQITVGDLVEMPTGKVFNFADDEDNYFAVMQPNE